MERNYTKTYFFAGTCIDENTGFPDSIQPPAFSKETYRKLHKSSLSKISGIFPT